MRPLYCFIIVFLTVGLTTAVNGQAQNLRIDGIRALSSDLSASVYSRNDYNGRACALVKVAFPKTGAEFEGNVIGKTEYKAGEYWVYLTADSKFLKMKHAEYIPLMIRFDDSTVGAVETKRVYGVKVSPVNNEIVQEKPKTPEEKSKIEHLSLAVRKDGKMYYYAKTLWDSISEKFRYEKVGVVVYVSEIPFIIDLSDTSNEIDWRKANKSYGAYLPTIQQANDIVKCFTALDNAIKDYGGQTIDRRTYWTKEPEYGGDWHKVIDSWSHKPASIISNPNTKSYSQSVRKVYSIE